MMQKTGKQDPLRISQESLDLDDIISDLNSEKAPSQHNPSQPLQIKTPAVATKEVKTTNPLQM